jgi:hypothetical protein
MLHHGSCKRDMFVMLAIKKCHDGGVASSRNRRDKPPQSLFVQRGSSSKNEASELGSNVDGGSLGPS